MAVPERDDVLVLAHADRAPAHLGPLARARACVRVGGSGVHDALYLDPAKGYRRETNGAGGLEGGMTNGEELIVRVAMKPIATLMKPLPTVNVVTHEASDAARERSDTTAVPAAGVVAEAMVALVLAEAVLEKFGGDSVTETRRNVAGYLQQVSDRGLQVAGS